MQIKNFTTGRHSKYSFQSVFAVLTSRKGLKKAVGTVALFLALAPYLSVPLQPWDGPAIFGFRIPLSNFCTSAYLECHDRKRRKYGRRLRSTARQRSEGGGADRGKGAATSGAQYRLPGPCQQSWPPLFKNSSKIIIFQPMYPFCNFASSEN